jgi:uncharacterized protein YndB with AHSA1/START domain
VENKPDWVFIIYIATTPEKLWDALTSPEFTEQYFFGRRIESDWKVGSTVTYWMPDGRPDVQGRVLQSDPPRLLSFTWRVVWNEELRNLPEGRVSFQLEPSGDVVRLTVGEYFGHPVKEEWLEPGLQGWSMILSGLKTLLETGRPLPLSQPVHGAQSSQEAAK